MLCSTLSVVKTLAVLTGLYGYVHVAEKTTPVGLTTVYQNHKVTIINDKDYFPCFKNNNLKIEKLADNVFKQHNKVFDQYLIVDEDIKIKKPTPITKELIRNISRLEDKYKVHIINKDVSPKTLVSFQNLTQEQLARQQTKKIPKKAFNKKSKQLILDRLVNTSKQISAEEKIKSEPVLTNGVRKISEESKKDTVKLVPTNAVRKISEESKKDTVKLVPVSRSVSLETNKDVVKLVPVSRSVSLETNKDVVKTAPTNAVRKVSEGNEKQTRVPLSRTVSSDIIKVTPTNAVRKVLEDTEKEVVITNADGKVIENKKSEDKENNGENKKPKLISTSRNVVDSREPEEHDSDNDHEYLKHVHKDLHEDVKQYVKHDFKTNHILKNHIKDWWKDEEEDDEHDIKKMKHFFKIIRNTRGKYNKHHHNEDEDD